MPWWKRASSRKNPRIDYGPDPEPPSVEEAAEEGMAMALSAAAMAIKNRILVSAITTEDTFDHDEYLPAAKEIVDTLREEARGSAELARRERESAETLKGTPRHQHDYRRTDVANLELRENTNREIADRLDKMRGDDDALRELIERGRDAAWGELAHEMQNTLERVELAEYGGPNYESERDERLRAFIAVDLFQLQIKSQREKKKRSKEDETARDY